jgi:hypothetical protein
VRLTARPFRAGANVEGLNARSVRVGVGGAEEGWAGGGSGGVGPGAGGPGGAGAGGPGACGAPQILPFACTSMSSTPTHSSWPFAFVVITRSCTSGRSSAAAGNAPVTGVTSLASPGPVVASATNAPWTTVKSPDAPTRYCSATGCTASAIDDRSMSRSR